MEPDFESTPEALVTRVELRSITSSQVLARPSEWLELLRRYGNVAPFFCLKRSRACFGQRRLNSVSAYVGANVVARRRPCRGAGNDERWKWCAGDSRPYVTLSQVSQFVPRVCLVFSGELKDYDAFANMQMPLHNERAS